MTSTASFINKLLNPYLFQVIGSTPSVLKDNLKKSGIESDQVAAAQMITVSLFAACVNKATLETMLIKQEFANVRPFISAALSISGKPNMTAITLLGHCMLTTDFLDSVVFASEFRRKLGQRNIWDGDLSKGSLSEKQMKIMAEKARLIDLNDAKLFASGFIKFCKLVPGPYTADEADFWGFPSAPTAAAPSDATPVPNEPAQKAAPAAGKAPKRPSPPGSVSAPSRELIAVVLSDGTSVYVDKEAFDYYMAVNNGNITALVDSVERRGADEFSSAYVRASNADPNRRGVGASRVA